MNKIVLGILGYTGYVAWRRMRIRQHINYKVIERYIYRIDSKIIKSDSATIADIANAQTQLESICWTLSNISNDVIKKAANEYIGPINEVLIIPLIAIISRYLQDDVGYKTEGELKDHVQDLFGLSNSKVYVVLTRCGFSNDEVASMKLFTESIMTNLEVSTPSTCVLPAINALIKNLINKVAAYIPL